MVAAKTKDIEALTASIDDTTSAIGELGVQIVQMKEDLSYAEEKLEVGRHGQDGLGQDEEFGSHLFWRTELSVRLQEASQFQIPQISVEKCVTLHTCSMKHIHNRI